VEGLAKGVGGIIKGVRGYYQRDEEVLQKGIGGKSQEGMG
jgi:hypothetical protein